MTRTRTRHAKRKRRRRDSESDRLVDVRASAAPETKSRIADRVWLTAIFVAALLLRILVLNRLLALPIHRTPQLDSLEFLLRAGRFQHGDFTPPLVPQHGPGYPFFIFLVFAVFPGSFLALGVVQCVLGSALCVVAASLGRRWFGTRVGIVAGLLLAFNGPLILLSGLILAEGLLLFLLLVCLLWFDPSDSSWPRMLGAGAVLGLATAVRPTAVLLLPLLAVAALRQRKSRAWFSAGTLALAFLLALTPVTLANARAGRGLFVIQGNAGLSFYLGNAPSGTGTASARLGGSWDSIAGDASRRGIEGPSAQDRYYVKRTLAEIRTDPGGFGRLFGRKFLSILQAAEVRDSHAFDFFAREIPLLRFLPGFGLLISLGACGLFLTARARTAPFLAVGYLLVFFASCLFLVVGFRYRSPVVPMLAIFAAVGAMRLYESLRNREFRVAGGLLVGVTGVWALSHLVPPPDDRRLAEEWSFTGNSLVKEGDLAAAESAYRTALSENARFAPAWTGLGTIALRRSDIASAGENFRRAIAAEPSFARAHFLLGAASEEHGDLPGAVLEYGSARKLRPDDPDALRALGRILSRMGRWTEAEEVARSFVRLYPEDAGGHLDLARVETALHHAPAAVAEAAQCTALDPSNADAWLLRGVLAIDSGNSADARTALQEAEALAGPGRPPIEYAWALLERMQNEPGAAESRLRGLLSRHPDFSEAATLLIEIATQNGHRQSAEAFLATLEPKTRGR